MFVPTNITRTCVTGQKSLYASIGIAAVLDWREQKLCWKYRWEVCGLTESRLTKFCYRSPSAKPHSSQTPLTTQGFQRGPAPLVRLKGPPEALPFCTSCRFRPVGRPSFLLAQKKEGKNCAVGGEPPLSARGSMTRSLLRVKRLWLTNTTRTCVTGQKSLYASIGIAAVLDWREQKLCWKYRWEVCGLTESRLTKFCYRSPSAKPHSSQTPVSGVAAWTRGVRPHEPGSCNTADNSGIPKGARPFGGVQGQRPCPSETIYPGM